MAHVTVTERDQALQRHGLSRGKALRDVTHPFRGVTPSRPQSRHNTSKEVI